ncbi:MAG: helix-turn-helix transcriptional regulator [Nocardioidaceae bacterium]|nr:helix-turn-helix transcriptional regulator [Nocardioidaceae bacterium]
MSRLLAMIDEYRDAHGQPSDASIARAIGIAPQTLNSWRKRGMRKLPNQETLRELARFLKRSEADVLYAAGVDTGYIIETEADPAADAAEAG